ncbi:MAG: SpoIIIAH-like family protein [Halanaerobiaceae bacterium]|nr:SpoIIIAH-like family protein [Halanaerobiaceae bacterium]
MLKRKLIWTMILMIWVGMVTSIIIYQGNEYLEFQPVSSDNPVLIDNLEIIEPGVTEQSTINFSRAKDEAGGETDFFIEYRIERDRSRSEQLSILKEIINNPNTDEASKKEAQRKLLAITDKMEKELEIESLIRARGYKEALAYIHNEAVDVIIHTNGLEKEDVARIGDIIVKVTGFSTEDVTIIEKKIKD